MKGKGRIEGENAGEGQALLRSSLWAWLTGRGSETDRMEFVKSSPAYLRLRHTGDRGEQTGGLGRWVAESAIGVQKSLNRLCLPVCLSPCVVWAIPAV